MTEDRISVLHIVKGIDIGGNSGGAENFGIRIARALNQKGAQVALCAFIRYGTPTEEEWFNRLNKEGIEVFFACQAARGSLSEGIRGIGEWISDHPTHMVHSHYQVGTICSIVLKALRKVKILIRTAHAGLEFGEGFNGAVSRVVFRDFLYPLFVTDEIGVSQSITANLNHQFIRKVINKPAVYIPNAIPDSDENENGNAALDPSLNGFPVQPWIITTAGILVAGKNLDILIKAVSEIRNQIPNVLLVIAGGGPEYKNLVALAERLGISESCRFLGQQPDVNSILQKSNVFILPSRSEGTSTVLLEAMENKVPVIASDIPGNRELVQHEMTGWLVPVGDISALSSAIMHAYDHPEEMKKVAEAAFTRLEPYYLSSVTDKYIEIYRSSLKISLHLR